MPFVFLLLFALLCLQSHWPEPRDWLTDTGCAMLVGTMVLTSWLAAWLISLGLCRQLDRYPEQRHALLRRYGRWRRNHFIALLLAYLATLYLLGWGHVLRALWLTWTLMVFPVEDSNNLPGFQIGLLLPFFVALLLAWERFHSFEQVAYESAHAPDRFIAKSSYLLTQIRHQFYLVVPPILLLLIQQLLFGLIPELNVHGYMPALIALGLMAGAFMLMPMLLRYFLGLKPMPAGPLRERLESAARRLGFRYSDILVWHTRYLFANAMVTGIVPWIRYIILTDRLIDELTPEEIESVFGHEVGHVKHHHLLFYVIFFLTSFIVLSLVWDLLKEWVTDDAVKTAILDLPYIGEDIWEALKTLSSFGKLLLLAGYTLFCFGLISRRCERQADLFGSAAVSTDAFISALEKVAAINGIPRDRSGNWLLSWQHPTIAQRVEFLEEMRAHPERIPRFHLRVQLLQLSFLFLLVGILWYFDLSVVLGLLVRFESL